MAPGRRYNTDSESYRDHDSGCRWASDFLGRQSSCFNCPFTECKYADFYADRDLKILGYHRQGRHECEIARALGLDRGTVHRVVKRALVGTV
jgi:hypothetical protein